MAAFIALLLLSYSGAQNVALLFSPQSVQSGQSRQRKITHAPTQIEIRAALACLDLAPWPAPADHCGNGPGLPWQMNAPGVKRIRILLLHLQLRLPP
jgi:hypothetical protein